MSRHADMSLHAAKVQAHRLLRWLDDRAAPIERARLGRAYADAPIVGEDRCSLWNVGIDPREWPLERGKVENLRVAAKRLDGLEFGGGQMFSFWAQLGRPARRRGFVDGRELREGCIVPGVAGGLCLLSNGLFAAAKRAGFEVIERHAHSRRPIGSRAELGEDATVAWNYVDLRFRSEHAWRLEVELGPDELRVRLRADGPARRFSVVHASRSSDHGASCLSCDQPCTRSRSGRAIERGRRVWLLDAQWPEYAAWLREHASPGDRLAIPIDGGLVGRERYAWPRLPGVERMQFPAQMLRRSLNSRRLADQGPARQRALLADSERLARAMAARLEPDDVELVVAQELLPWLWRLGALGGRRTTVLMQRLPLAELHAVLDRAAAAHPNSSTLADFRADRELVVAESRALEHAESIVTPHSEIAALFGPRAMHLDWMLSLPRVRTRPQRRPGPARIWFPASTVGRKGAYELRAALEMRSAVKTILHMSGREVEAERFWQSARSVEVRPATGLDLDEIDVAVLPAWVEHSPRALLRAVSAGVPVIASRACGLAGVPGVIEVPTGDIDALHSALAAVLDARVDSQAAE